MSLTTIPCFNHTACEFFCHCRPTGLLPACYSSLTRIPCFNHIAREFIRHPRSPGLLPACYTLLTRIPCFNHTASEFLPHRHSPCLLQACYTSLTRIPCFNRPAGEFFRPCRFPRYTLLMGTPRPTPQRVRTSWLIHFFNLLTKVLLLYLAGCVCFHNPEDCCWPVLANESPFVSPDRKWVLPSRSFIP